jgi:hypothetical protein
LLQIRALVSIRGRQAAVVFFTGAADNKFARIRNECLLKRNVKFTLKWFTWPTNVAARLILHIPSRPPLEIS